MKKTLLFSALAFVCLSFGTASAFYSYYYTDVRPVLGACWTDYMPVCGSDGQTYQNACYAHNAGKNIKYDGSCRDHHWCRYNDCVFGTSRNNFFDYVWVGDRAIRIGRGMR
jgi:hypothetical protein